MFTIANNKIQDFDGEVDGTSHKYQLYETSFGIEKIFYKTINEKIESIICESFSQETATRSTNEFLLGISL